MRDLLFALAIQKWVPQVPGHGTWDSRIGVSVLVPGMGGVSHNCNRTRARVSAHANPSITPVNTRLFTTPAQP